MSEFDATKWYDQVLAALAALGGAAGAGKLFDLYNESKKRKAEATARETDLIESSRQEYQAQLHEDWQYYRAELRKIEEMHRECERNRLLVEGELFRLREQLQILQLKCDNLEEEIEELKKR